MEDFSNINPQPSIPPTSLAGIISSLQQIARGQSAIQTAIAALNTTVGTKFSPVFVPVPANSAAAGVYGQVAIDASFFYCYTGTAWRRVAVAAF